MDDTVLAGKFRGALLGTMVGDALGAPVEGWECDLLNDVLDVLPDAPRPERETAAAVIGLITGEPILPGLARYTDDTQMTIGVAQSLIAMGDVDCADMAQRFACNFDPARGYGMGAHVVLRALKNGAEWDTPARKLFGGNGSWGNGAAMRAAPIGLFFADAPPNVLRQKAGAQSTITHTHPLGKEGAVLQAASVAVAVKSYSDGAFDPAAFLEAVRALTGPLLPEYETALQTVRRFLDTPPRSRETVADTLGNGIEAHLSVPVALYSFLSHSNSFTDAVQYAVRLGGDADTIGALCGAIAGAFHGEAGLPTVYLDALENGPQGRDFVRVLADDLFVAYQRNAA